jgi:hypothetical protein
MISSTAVLLGRLPAMTLSVWTVWLTGPQHQAAVLQGQPPLMLIPTAQETPPPLPPPPAAAAAAAAVVVLVTLTLHGYSGYKRWRVSSLTS